MKKSIFLILPAVMLMLASCMDSAGGNGGAGSVRVVLPGSSRDVSGSDKADSYTVSLLKGGKVIESQTAVPGGAVEFDEVDAGSYTVDVEATLSGALSGVGSAEVAVTEGETASCTVLMNRVYTADAAVEYIESLKAGSYKVIVAGAIDDGGIEGIKTALNENNINKPLVSLDLGRTTGLSSIGAAKFQNCTALSGIVLPEGIGSINESAFEGCTSLASVTIPDTVNEIGQSAFRDCSALKSIEIPNSVTTIASGVFRDCTALSAIVLPEGIDSINESAFEGCTSLASVTIPDTVNEIGQYAFCDCSALKSVVIPNNVTKISAAVFQSCTSLESAVISNTATSIGIDAFNSCTSLKTVVIPVSITSIGDKAFESCGSLETVYYGGTKAEWGGIKFVGSSSNDLSNVTIICSDATITP